MNKKKLAAMVVSVALIGVIAIGATLAYFTDTQSKQNVVTMGKVDGELTEPEWDKDNTDSHIENVKPGDTITKDPQVTMADDSEDAYARFKVVVTAASGSTITADKLSELKFYKGTGANKTEVKFDAEGYFYVQDILSASDNYLLFDSVEIPADWGNTESMATFNIDVTVDLVQADNFAPTKDGNGNITSWGAVAIEAAK